MSLIILRSTNRAIKNIIDDTAIVASGRLDHEVKGSGAEELRSLADSINRMRLALRDMIARRMNMLIGVSHDLKTPIALIQGYTDALSDNMASDEATRMHYLEIIREKSVQLEDLVSDLIEFMKIDDFNVPQEIVDLETIMISLGKRFEEDARLLGLELTYGFGRLGAAPSREALFSVPKVKMNRSLFERAVENLVSNAFRYTGPGGKVELLLNMEEGQPVLTVADNGPGIPNEELAYIFDAFYRGTPSRQEAGYGLGLTIVKLVVDLHGWSISAQKQAAFRWARSCGQHQDEGFGVGGAVRTWRRLRAAQFYEHGGASLRVALRIRTWRRLRAARRIRTWRRAAYSVYAPRMRAVVDQSPSAGFGTKKKSSPSAVLWKPASLPRGA